MLLGKDAKQCRFPCRLCWARICKRLKGPRNRFEGLDFRGICSLVGRYLKGSRTGPPGWQSIPRLLKRSKNTGSVWKRWFIRQFRLHIYVIFKRSLLGKLKNLICYTFNLCCGSGSFYHLAKKNLDSYCFVPSFLWHFVFVKWCKWTFKN